MWLMLDSKSPIHENDKNFFRLTGHGTRLDICQISALVGFFHLSREQTLQSFWLIANLTRCTLLCILFLKVVVDKAIISICLWQDMTSIEFVEIWRKKRPLFSFDEAELESGSWKQCLIPNLSNLNISFQPPMEFYILSPISNRADSLICQISLEAIISIKLIAEIS